jgi:hypothetical protein
VRGGAVSVLDSSRLPAGRAALLIAAAVWLSCASPEASRTRGGGPGADPGNRRDTVQFHDGADPYYLTPCATTLEHCDGPRAVFGPVPRDTGSRRGER